jgi:hypothetical protein
MYGLSELGKGVDVVGGLRHSWSFARGWTPGDPKGRRRKLKTDNKDNIVMSAEEPC